LNSTPVVLAEVTDSPATSLRVSRPCIRRHSTKTSEVHRIGTTYNGQLPSSQSSPSLSQSRYTYSTGKVNGSATDPSLLKHSLENGKSTTLADWLGQKRFDTQEFMLIPRLLVLCNSVKLWILCCLSVCTPTERCLKKIPVVELGFPAVNGLLSVRKFGATW
jgi:hypothetical protein